jgi:hypothetical protein
VTARVWVIAFLVTAATPAAAEPRIAIRATGTCPSAAAIERALPSRVRVGPEGTGELLVVEQVDGGAIVRMTTARGPIDAHLESHNCAVLAAAVAAVADAWFVELPAPAAPASSIALASPAASGAPGSSGSVAERVDAPTTRVSPRWHLAVARALVTDPGRASTSASTHVDVGWWSGWRDVRLSARVALGGKTDLATTDVMNTATRQTWGVSLSLARRAGAGRFWLEGGGGAAAVLSRVAGGTVQQSGEVFRAHGAVAASLAAGVRLGASASLRFDVSGLLYPIRDRYTIPSTTVARSPLADLAAGIGLEVGFGERLW